MGRSGSRVSQGAAGKTRLYVLIAIFIALFGVALPRWFYQTKISQVKQALGRQDNRLALQRVDQLERWFGANAESSLLAARAYRRLADLSAFQRKIDRAKGLKGDPAWVRHEENLKDASLGLVSGLPSKFDAMLKERPEDFEETADAILQGLLLQQDIDNALKVLVVWESQSPDSPGVPLYHGVLALRRRDWKMARDRLEPAFERHPNFVPYLLQLGITYSGLREDQLAADRLERYLAHMPSDTNASIKYADVLTRLGRGEDALKVLESLISAGNGSIDIRLQAGQLYLDQQKPDRTLELLAKSARAWPEDAALASAMSRAYALKGDDEKASLYADIASKNQKELEKADSMYFALMGKPTCTADECYELGHLLLHKQSRENGIYWLEAALRLDPSHQGAHRDMAHFYRQSDQPRLAQVHRSYLKPETEPP
ncbi:MAG: tetratricopeptide repeat protein [Planctomycetota bacterium]|jgi:tetratricopeptide (TPR) repeat protein